MNRKNARYILLTTLLLPFGKTSSLYAQISDVDTTSVREQTMAEASVTAAARPTTKMTGAQNGFTLSRTEIFKAACCNLGESFTTNPSVDVSYSDAATGARQIKLLGLAGSYVQMLTENVPDFRGAASPYGLGYVPGPWMQSIQVSKGSASVKNGYESITGQINVEYKKPQSENTMELNLYGDTKSRYEANLDGNIHLTEKLSTGLLAHYEDNYGHHDENGDGFLDKANVRQTHIMNRWAWMGDRYIFQAAVSGLGERREGGQRTHSHHESEEKYLINSDATRFAAFAKNAFIFNKEKATNLALILSANYHDADATFGHRRYDVTQKTGYASLLFETNFTPEHSLSAGLSVNHDYFKQRYNLSQQVDETSSLHLLREKETTPGVYAQYTFNHQDEWIVMAGLRADHSSVYGTFVTPRFHVKYAPTKRLSFRLSAGKGYRTVHALAENNYLLASNRTLSIDDLKQESAWNYGLSTNWKLPVGGHILDLSAEYFYTHFQEQSVIDYDADTHHIYIHNLNGERSYSHTFQVEGTYTFVRGLTATAAYRYNLVRQFAGGKLREKPLTSRYKALLTLTYKTPLELWQFDATGQLNGSGRLPYNGVEGLSTHFPHYFQCQAQITRWFKHWSIYVGGENLTNYKQRTPIIEAAHPWSDSFDATQVWGPVHGAMAYIGVRITPFNL